MGCKSSFFVPMGACGILAGSDCGGCHINTHRLVFLRDLAIPLELVVFFH